MSSTEDSVTGHRIRVQRRAVPLLVALGVAGLVACGSPGTEDGGGDDPAPLEYDPVALEKQTPCEPMTEDPRITVLDEIHGSPAPPDVQGILVAVEPGPPPGSDGRDGEYRVEYSSADGAETEEQLDQLRGGYSIAAAYPDGEYAPYNLALVVTTEVPGYREMVVARSVSIQDESYPDYVDLFDAICGTVGFTVGTEGNVSDAVLVENPDAGTFEYIGQLR
jgi:hypothetical protein